MTSTHQTRTDIYQQVTDAIITELQQGPDAWSRGWRNTVALWCPKNRLTKAPYRGVNLLLLAMACRKRGHHTNSWATFRQALDLGAHVRKGAKGVPLVLFKPLDGTTSDDGLENDNDARTPSRVIVRHFYVFHTTDLEGLPEAVHEVPQDHALAARIIEQSGARIVPGEPAYRVADDLVQLPDARAFDSQAEYLATAMHELIHFTATRVDRPMKMQRFGDDAYALEELVAELGAAMLCGVCGVAATSRCAAYLDHWLRVLRADKRAIFTAAAQAQRAADYLLDRAGVQQKHDEHAAA